MNEMTNYANPIMGFGEVEYGLKCAADLALCLSIAADSDEMAESGKASVLADALHILHEYLSGLYDMQENGVDLILEEKRNRAE